MVMNATNIFNALKTRLEADATLKTNMGWSGTGNLVVAEGTPTQKEGDPRIGLGIFWETRPAEFQSAGTSQWNLVSVSIEMVKRERGMENILKAWGNLRGLLEQWRYEDSTFKMFNIHVVGGDNPVYDQQTQCWYIIGTLAIDMVYEK